MMRLTETVKHLIIINVLIYFGYYGLAQSGVSLPNLAVYFPGTDNFRPYQLVSHMFMHGSTSHLFFNMLMLFFMGPIVEQRLGKKKFITMYMAAGLLATLFDWIVSYVLIQFGLMNPAMFYVGHVGASGAIFGVIAAFGILFPNMQVMLLIPPMPIKGKYLAIGLIVLGFLMDFGGNVGHLSHIGGALVGAAIIYYWKKNTIL